MIYADNAATTKACPAAQQAMRQSTKNILYVTVNSRAYTEENFTKATATPAWRIILTVVDVIAGVVLVGGEALLIKSWLKKKKEG